jgi:hypothetical protein
MIAINAKVHDLYSFASLMPAQARTSTMYRIICVQTRVTMDLLIALVYSFVIM